MTTRFIKAVYIYVNVSTKITAVGKKESDYSTAVPCCLNLKYAYTILPSMLSERESRMERIKCKTDQDYGKGLTRALHPQSTTLCLRLLLSPTLCLRLLLSPTLCLRLLLSTTLCLRLLLSPTLCLRLLISLPNVQSSEINNLENIISTKENAHVRHEDILERVCGGEMGNRWSHVRATPFK